MTRAADLAQLHVNDALRLWPQAAFLATLLVAVSYAEAATDYPPPPGPYHSEPMVLPELPVTPQTSAGSTAEGAPRRRPTSRQNAWRFRNTIPDSSQVHTMLPTCSATSGSPGRTTSAVCCNRCRTISSP